MIGFFLALSFLTPWVLMGLVAIPLILLIMRAIPPAPIRRVFPAVVLLLGLSNKTHTSDKTPWWLLFLRTLVLATLVIGMAGPILNKHPDPEEDSDLLIVLDGSWASANGWTQTLENISNELARAKRRSSKVALLNLSDIKNI